MVMADTAKETGCSRDRYIYPYSGSILYQRRKRTANCTHLKQLLGDSLRGAFRNHDRPYRRSMA